MLIILAVEPLLVREMMAEASTCLAISTAASLTASGTPTTEPRSRQGRHQIPSSSSARSTMRRIVATASTG